MTAPTAATAARHPAKFSDDLLRRVALHVPQDALVLDPFAGVGRIHRLTYARTVGVELEPEWACQHQRTVVANALTLPFPDGVFDVIATSPVYGNRMSDHHDARDTSRRITYRHTLGRKLHPDNAGQLQWGSRYRVFHETAWAEALRVLKIGGRFVLNVSDHIRKGERQHVTAWHIQTLRGLGCALDSLEPVATQRMRHGENYGARVDTETVAAFTWLDDAS